MKFVVVSDIHGSNFYAQKINEILERENPDKIILLGDLYYHGPRNPLPKDYNPKAVCALLNSLKDKIYCVRGNCDAEVDQMISEFKINLGYIITLNDKKFMFTHGHIINKDNCPDDIDVLVYGHFHTGFILKTEDKIFVNAGSMSLPKNNTKNSYVTIDNEEIVLKDLDGNIITSTIY